MSFNHPNQYSALRLLSLLSALALSPYSSALAQEEPPAITDLSETETSYAGARLLRNGENVRLGELRAGRHDDLQNRDRYLFWQGDSLFLGAIDLEDNNRLDVVAEFYWFESSLPRNSDFYVIVLKVTAAPATNTDWRIATPASAVDSVLFRDIGAVQRVEAAMDRNGENGAIRWDWSLPFQNYRWEPERVIEIEQEYAAGAHIEGSAMRDLSEGVNVQAKGFLDAQTRVSTRYTITLWRWEMLVQAGATDMDWALIALDPEHEQDPAYHEYFLVLQAERNVPVRIDHLQFATTMRKRVPLFFDDFRDISVRLRNIELSSPQDPCEEGFRLEGAQCVPVCPAGYELEGEECVLVCPEGYIAIEDECLGLCPDGYIWLNGDCHRECPPDEVEVDGECELICEDGRVSVARRCEEQPSCPEGERLEGDRCISICRDDERWEGGTCVDLCPEGFTAEGDVCVPDCEEGYRAYEMECVPTCPEGFDLVMGECEPSCEPGRVWRDGQCSDVCPEGFSLVEGQCQRLCPEGASYQEGRCVLPCPEGSELIGEECVSARDEGAALSEGPQAKEGCAAQGAPQAPALLLLMMCAALSRRPRQS